MRPRFADPRRMESVNQQSRTDWARVDATCDEDIDYSDNPMLTAEFFEKAVRWPVETNPFPPVSY